MTWQAVAISAIVLAYFCFYKWCNTNIIISANHLQISERQAEISRNNVEYQRMQLKQAGRVRGELGDGTTQA